MSLSYPIEMYYPDYDFEIPKLEDQILIISEYKDYIHDCNEKEIQPDLTHLSIQAMNFLLGKLKQETYFKGVRDIVNFIYSEEKTPDELFSSMFPDRESLVYLFKKQFLDACELVEIEDCIDWQKMNLRWKNFNIKNEKQATIEEIKTILEEKITILNQEESNEKD